MINLIIGTLFGLAIGATFSVMASDPCDKSNRYSYESQRDSEPRWDGSDRDPSMQFYWRDHQPSQHAR